MIFNTKNIFRIAPFLIVFILGTSVGLQAQIVVAQPLNFDGGFSSMLSGFHVSDNTKNTSNQLQTIEPKSAISKAIISDIKNNDESQYIILDNAIYKICPNDKNTLIKIYPKEAVPKKITKCSGTSNRNKHK